MTPREIDPFLMIPERSTALSKKEANLAQRWQLEVDRLIARDHFDRRAMLDWQFETLRRIVDNAVRYIPFYRRKYGAEGFCVGDLTSWNDYDQLPVLTKDELIEASEEVRDLFVSQGGVRHESRTSGSSGRILTLFQDEATNNQHLLYYRRFFETVAGPRDGSFGPDLYQIYLCPERTTSIGDGFTVRTVSLDAGETEVLEDIRTCRPRILWGFASYFLRLRRTFGNGLRELGIQAVITNSEASSRLERRLLSEAFGCPVYDEYSSEELYLIATERLCEQYHLVEDSVRVDVIDPDESGVGRLCGTSLVDAGFPMIRYEQGDVGRITEFSEQRGCECGSHARILDRFQGRADQHLVLTGGGVLEGDRLMLLYDENLLPARAGLRAFRIIQEQAGSATLVAVAESSKAVSAWEKFRSDIERMTEGRLMMQVEWVDQLPHIPGTKRRLVFSSVPETMQSPLPVVQQVEG